MTLNRPAVVVGLLAVFLLVRGVRGCPRGGRAAPPIDITPEPVQEELPAPLPGTIRRGDRTFMIGRSHRYVIAGRVLSASTYDLAWTNDLFDVDLGLVWGDHADALMRRFTFYQDARWLFWRSDTPVSDAERLDVTTHAGNEHLIPEEGDPQMATAIRAARAGDLVRIEGWLVTIRDAAGDVLARSSVSRDDTGNGACEIVWVDRFQLNGKVWE